MVIIFTNNKSNLIGTTSKEKKILWRKVIMLLLAPHSYKLNIYTRPTCVPNLVIIGYILWPLINEDQSCFLFVGKSCYSYKLYIAHLRVRSEALLDLHQVLTQSDQNYYLCRVKFFTKFLSLWDLLLYKIWW